MLYTFRFQRILSMENGTDWKLNRPMSPAESSCEKGYADLRCTSERSQDIRENMNAWKMEHSKRFTFSLVSRDPFYVQQR